MADTAKFTATPRIGMAKVVAADTAKDDPVTNIYTVITGAASGTRIDRVVIKLLGVTGSASTNNVVRLFLNDATNKRLLKEVEISSSTPSATAAGSEYVVSWPNGLILPSATWSLVATMHTRAGAADDQMVFAFGGDF